MRKLFFLIALFFLGNCGMHMQIVNSANIDNSPAAKEKRKPRCKSFCDKQHYPDVKLTEADGTLRIIKIHIVSIDDKDVCVCKF